MKAIMIHPGLVLQNRFVVVQQLAEGGFCQTFEVDDQGTRKVLKVLKLPRVLDEDYRKAVLLIQQEQEVLSQLDDPGIPRVEPDGYFTWPPENPEPLHCLVMEKIDGCNLDQWLISQNNQPITSEQALTWLKQLVKILEKVHRQDFFHRDIKPSNIMLKPNGQLVLIDFGAVREVTDTYLGRIGSGREVTTIGTSGYAPIEQMEGKAVPQSDFFALGRTFVHLLTGEHPIDLQQDPQTGQLIWRDYAPQVPQNLAELIEDLIATFPGKRPQNTKIIQQRLTEIEFALINGLPMNIQNSLSVSEQQQEASEKDHTKRGKFSSIKTKLGFVASLLLGLAIVWSNLPKVAVVCNNWGLDNYSAERLEIAKFFYKCAFFVQSDYAKPHYNLGLVYEKQQKIDLARSEYEIAVQGKNVSAHNNLARLNIILDKNYIAAVDLLQKGLQLEPDAEVKYTILKNLGWALKEQTRYTEAETYLREAIKLKNAQASAHCVLAQVIEAQGNKQKALMEWEKCRIYPASNTPEEKVWRAIARKVSASAIP